jgi:hypothetical protein
MTASAAAAPRGERRQIAAREDDVALEYVGRSALLLKGPLSGRVYALRPDERRVLADARDAPAFLASPLFDLARVEP